MMSRLERGLLSQHSHDVETREGLLVDEDLGVQQEGSRQTEELSVAGAQSLRHPAQVRVQLIRQRLHQGRQVHLKTGQQRLHQGRQVHLKTGQQRLHQGRQVHLKAGQQSV